MKVGITIRRWSERGGLEGNVLGLARHLVDRGHEVHVVAQRFEADAHGVATHRLDGVPAWPEWRRIQRFSSIAARALVEIGCDVTFTSSAVTGPEVVRLEGGLVEEYWSAYPSARWQPRERVLARIDHARIAQSKAVLTLSDMTAEAIAERHAIARSRIHVVRNGVDLEHFLPEHPSLSLHHARAPVVGFVGSGFRRKGLAPLIRAMQGLKARLLVAGSDRRAAQYVRLAQRLGVDLEYLGFVHDVRTILRRADVIAAPSFYDPFGLVVLEALAVGRPVVTTRTTGAHEISPFSDLVVEAPRPELLREALKRAFLHAALPDTVERARTAAMAWPRDRTYAQVEAILHSVANSGIP